MKLAPAQGRPAGFTLVELLVVLAIISLLAALLLPGLVQGKKAAKRIVCINNLRQIGISFQMFAHDHNTRFPMEVPVADGGSLDFVQNDLRPGSQFFDAYHSFKTLASAGAAPAEFICPTDDRRPAASMASLANPNVSFFIGVSARYFQPNSVLAGDRNIEWPDATNATRQTVSGGQVLRWTRELHYFQGDILFADGRVENRRQRWVLASDPTATNPSVMLLPALGPVAASGPNASANAYAQGYGSPGGNAYHPPSGSGSNQPARPSRPLPLPQSQPSGGNRPYPATPDPGSFANSPGGAAPGGTGSVSPATSHGPAVTPPPQESAPNPSDPGFYWLKTTVNPLFFPYHSAAGSWLLLLVIATVLGGVWWRLFRGQS